MKSGWSIFLTVKIKLPANTEINIVYTHTYLSCNLYCAQTVNPGESYEFE